MKSFKSSMFAALAGAVLVCSQSAHASILFLFTEVGGSVIMTSSGTLDTSKLLSSTFPDGWGGTGTEHNGGAGDIDIMGGTSFGGINTLFKFHAGTDASAISGPAGPFAFNDFSWTVTGGSKSFSTYAGHDGGVRVPGIGMRREDMVGDLWTPDQAWSQLGTFASLGLNPGIYAVSDAVTGETITIKIGGAVNAPDGGATLALLGAALLGLAALRRRIAT